MLAARSRRNFARQLLGFLNRVAGCFSFSVDWLNIALQTRHPLAADLRAGIALVCRIDWN
jgi:hypothetical protein